MFKTPMVLFGLFLMPLVPIQVFSAAVNPLLLRAN